MPEKLKLHLVREGYIDFLRKIDHRVQYNKSQTRPYVGVVLHIGTHQYFAPLESPKPSHATMKTGVHYFRIDGGALGVLNFNNMIPIKDHLLVNFDINAVPDPQYRRLLQKQAQYCNKHRGEIQAKALKTYENYKKGVPFFVKICCDFKKLEASYTNYYYKVTVST